MIIYAERFYSEGKVVKESYGLDGAHFRNQDLKTIADFYIQDSKLNSSVEFDNFQGQKITLHNCGGNGIETILKEGLNAKELEEFAKLLAR